MQQKSPTCWKILKWPYAHNCPKSMYTENSSACRTTCLVSQQCSLMVPWYMIPVFITMLYRFVPSPTTSQNTPPVFADNYMAKIIGSTKILENPIREGLQMVVINWKFCFVCWLLIVPATCECISGTDLHRQFYVLPHWDRSCKSNFPSHPVTVYLHRADQSQCWPYNARRLAG